MQDLRKNKRKMMQQASKMSISPKKVESLEEISACDEDTRGSKPCSKQKVEHCKPHHNKCEHSKCDHDDCIPCGEEGLNETCVKNICSNECGNAFKPSNFSNANSIPLAIEANRVFDTMAFQTFKDATTRNGEPVSFVIDVVEVIGAPPRMGEADVRIDKVCISYDEIRVIPGEVTLEDYRIKRKEVTENCQSDFEYEVCGEKDMTCNKPGRGSNVAYKQRGLKTEVDGLVLELRGKCGCTEFIALAYPAVKKGCKLEQIYTIQFAFNTLTAPLVVPADGKSFVLRQDYKTNITVDCIGKAILKCECDPDCCDVFYCLEIPNGIDVVCCLEETVSALVSEQVVVLGFPNQIRPRIADTFSTVCNFSNNNDDDSNNSCGC